MSTGRKAVRIGITVGDPAGVGPEVILKSLLGHGEEGGEPILKRAEVLLIGPAWVFRDVARQFGFRVRFEGMQPDGSASGRGVPTLPVRIPNGCEEEFEIPYGREDPRCGAVALRAIEEAAALALGGEIDAIVTAPISKAAIHAAGSPFPGHTEMLQSLSHSAEVGMMLVGGGLRVSLVTIHMALAQVPSVLTVERVAGMLRLTHSFLRQWGIGLPRLALAGFNPHAGEGGLFGDEEIRVLIPAVRAAAARGISVEGPLAPDTVFFLAREGHFDAVVALYHDQALIPVKTLDFHGGVNVTMGLPFVRTSPDHGTAYGIAGRGVARANSMRNALEVAIDLVEKRRVAG